MAVHRMYSGLRESDDHPMNYEFGNILTDGECIDYFLRQRVAKSRMEIRWLARAKNELARLREVEAADHRRRKLLRQRREKR